MNRAVVAFMIAPLTVPAVVGSLGVMILVAFSPIASPFHNPFPNSPMVIGMAVLSALFSYGGAIVFGIPSYLWLRKRGINAFWTWPAWGFGVGAATGFVFLLLVFLLTVKTPEGDYSVPQDLLGLAVIWLLLTGSLGALAGTAHRLIAPPRDRVARGKELKSVFS